MPADVRTELPGHAGEKKLAKQLVNLQDERLHLWFSLDSIPRVTDIDVLLWHEDCGIFVVEVKAIPLRMIEDFQYARCTIEGRPPGPSPQKQAQRASERLRDHLHAHRVPPLFIVSTACFPEITRREWNAGFESTPFAGEFSETLLFKDDIQSSRSIFAKRLHHIWRRPPTREGSDREFKHAADRLARMHAAIVPSARPTAAVSDLEKLRVIEREEASKAIDEAPADHTTRMIYAGHPGTGKTFRLLQIGDAHAISGKRVLYSCFNKVLAADIDRMMGASKMLPLVTGSVTVRDVFDLLAEYAQNLQVTPDDVSESYDQWGQLITEWLEEHPEEVLDFDTVLIDEAQDMTDWQLKFLLLHARDDASIIVAVGTGQELYNASSEVLEELRSSLDVFPLRRNFRNTEPTFRFAYSVHESQFDIGSLDAAIKRFRKVRKQENGMLFPRKGGEYPTITSIDLAVLDELDSHSSFYAEFLNDQMVAGYAALIDAQLDDMDSRECPLDLLILVPSETCPEARWARAALDQLGQAFVDLTHPSLRRTGVPSTHVRLCTFHSSRGIEGNRVLILGFSRIEDVCAESKSEPHSLAYIVLSRAVFETVFACRPTEVDRGSMAFLGTVLDRLQ